MIIFSILSLLVAFLFVLLGIQFRRGKWLRLIAGNNFNELPQEVAINSGKKTGFVMCFAGLFCIFIAWWLLFSENQVLLWIVLGIYLFFSLLLLVTSLKKWIKEGI